MGSRRLRGRNGGELGRENIVWLRELIKERNSSLVFPARTVRLMCYKI